MPPCRVASRLLVGTSIVWAGVRGLLLVFGVGFGSFRVAAVVTAVVVTLSMLEIRRRDDHFFLANLGIPLSGVAAAVAVAVAALEACATVVAGLV